MRKTLDITEQPPRRRRPRTAFWRSQGGATAMEFALVAPCVVMILLSTIEVGVLAFMSASLDNALRAAARTVRTGQADGPATATAFEQRICTLMPETTATCTGRLSISVRRFASFTNVAAAAADAPAGEFDRGGAGDIMLVKANYRWPLLTPFTATAFRGGDSQVTLDARLTFRNEPYS